MSWDIQYTKRAEQDLNDIYNYISFTLQAPQTAINLMERIFKSVRSLADFPLRKPLYQEEPWHSQGLRFMPVDNYLVFYQADKGNQIVRILRIMHGSRDISEQLR